MFWKRRSSASEVPVAVGRFTLNDQTETVSPTSVPTETRASERLDVANTDPRPSPKNGARTFVVPSGYKISGSVLVRGTLRVDGELSGKGVFASRIVVSPAGRLSASSEAAEALLEGEVAGPVKVRGLLELGSSARVSADIEAQYCSVQAGAELSGAMLSVGAKR